MRPLELAREEEQDIGLRRNDLRRCMEEREKKWFGSGLEGPSHRSNV